MGLTEPVIIYVKDGDVDLFSDYQLERYEYGWDQYQTKDGEKVRFKIVTFLPKMMGCEHVRWEVVPTSGVADDRDTI